MGGFTGTEANFMWNWLKAIVQGLFAAVFDWGQAQVEKPPTITDEKTDPKIKRDWDSYIADKLRDKNNDRDK